MNKLAYLKDGKWSKSSWCCTGEHSSNLHPGFSENRAKSYFQNGIEQYLQNWTALFVTTVLIIKIFHSQLKSSGIAADQNHTFSLMLLLILGDWLCILHWNSHAGWNTVDMPIAVACFDWNSSLELPKGKMYSKWSLYLIPFSISGISGFHLF